MDATFLTHIDIPETEPEGEMGVVVELTFNTEMMDKTLFIDMTYKDDYDKQINRVCGSFSLEDVIYMKGIIDGFIANHSK